MRLGAEIERLTAALKATEQARYNSGQTVDRLTAENVQLFEAIGGATRENARLQAALEPFARNVNAVSLSEALGHISREHLLNARKALANEQEPLP